MELNIAIDPEQINKLVADAVLESAIGDQVKKIVSEHVAKLGQTWNNPLDSVISNHVAVIVRDTLIADHSDAIKAKIREQLAAKLTDDFISKVIEKGLSSY